MGHGEWCPQGTGALGTYYLSGLVLGLDHVSHLL